MDDEVFIPIDLHMLIIYSFRKLCCGNNTLCEIVCFGIRMFVHFSSAILEFIVLNIDNLEYARCDSPSTGLFGWLISLLIIMPFAYIGFLVLATKNFKAGSWAFKGFSIFFDIFFISYTLYITKTLQGNYGSYALFIIIDIGIEFASSLFSGCYFYFCITDNIIWASN